MENWKCHLQCFFSRTTQCPAWLQSGRWGICRWLWKGNKNNWTGRDFFFFLVFRWTLKSNELETFSLFGSGPIPWDCFWAMIVCVTGSAFCVSGTTTTDGHALDHAKSCFPSSHYSPLFNLFILHGNGFYIRILPEKKKRASRIFEEADDVILTNRL